MIAKNPKMFILLTAVITLLAASGCGFIRREARVGALQTRSETVALNGAKTGNVEIAIGAGELDVSGGAGASELLQANFTYNIAELEPQVSYRDGRLTVLTPNVSTGIGSWSDIDEYRYKWELHLNENVPIAMSVDVGVGSANLKLGSLSLTRLNLHTGLGPVTVDLTGDWQHNLDANIQGGLGGLTLRVPHSACVSVGVDGGLGDIDAQGLIKDGEYYTNAACREASVTLHIDIEAGVGSVLLQEG